MHRTLDRHRVALDPSGILVGGGLGHLTPGAVAAIAAGWKPVLGMRAPTSAGAPARTRIAGPFASAVGAAHWTLEDIEPQYRPVVGADGIALHMADGSTVGTPATPTRQWYAGELASACCAAARDAWNAALISHDATHLASACNWIANTYTALNVCCQCDPPWRFAWRRFVSGNASNPSAEFSPSQNFNDACTVRDQLSPRTFVSSRPAGSILAGARGVFERCAPAGSRGALGQFAWYFWLGQSIAPNLPLPAGVDRNTGVAPSRDSDRLAATAPALQNYADTRGTVVALLPPGGAYAAPGTVGFGALVASDCTALAGDASRWDAYGMDTGFVGFSPPPLRYGASQHDYIAWLDAVITSLEARTPAQAVQDARQFALYLNSGTVAAAYSNLDQAIGAMSAAETQEWGQNPTVVADLRLVGAGAPAIGAVVTSLAVIGGATGAASAGIGALVAGSIAAIVTVAAALWPPDDGNKKLDDLLRPRPWIERSWLAGTPSNQTREIGAPTDLVVPPPPGWSGARDAEAGGDPRRVRRPPASGGAGGVVKDVVLVGGAAAAVTYALDALDVIDVGRWFKRRR
jgi:hypothetical protein